MKYDWILFDADNTLFDFNRSSYSALKNTFHDFDLPFEKAYIDCYHQVNHQCWLAFEKGEMTAQTLRSERFRRFLEAMHIQGNAPELGRVYLQHLAQSHDLLDEAKALLDRLFKKVNLVIVTNGLHEVQRSRFQLAQVTHYFKAIVVSDEIGVSKPDTAFFDYTFQNIGNPEKAKVLMVGDSLSSDIKGGQQYGLDTCWFNPKQKKNDSEIQATYELNSLELFEQVLSDSM